MKVGSIVECVARLELAGYDFMTINASPIKGERYTVRGIKPSKNPGSNEMLLMFEEFVIGFNNVTGEELAAPMGAFREIEFPPSFEKELNEVIEEVINQPLEV